METPSRSLWLLIFDHQRGAMLMVEQKAGGNSQQDTFFRLPGGAMPYRYKTQNEFAERRIRHDTGLLLRTSSCELLYKITKDTIVDDQVAKRETSCISFADVRPDTPRPLNQEICSVQWLPYRDAYDMILSFSDPVLSEPLVDYFNHGFSADKAEWYFEEINGSVTRIAPSPTL